MALTGTTRGFKMETPNWNRDKFGAYVEEGKSYNTKRPSTMMELKPIEGESADGYTRRIMSMIQQLEDTAMRQHVFGGASGKSKMWYTHRMPQCWICDQINMSWMLFESYNAVCQALPEQGKNHIFKFQGNGIFKLVDMSGV